MARSQHYWLGGRVAITSPTRVTLTGCVGCGWHGVTATFVGRHVCGEAYRDMLIRPGVEKGVT
ncbi:MAG: hypothetical protein R3B91_07620 [Planctomycetaceae bacterium]